ncbi:hypothetical protein GW915_11510 [bacterium]|nr:hypothetical protein [bacterium]
MKKLATIITLTMLATAPLAFSESESNDGESYEWTPSDESSTAEDYATEQPSPDSEPAVEYETEDTFSSEE